MSVRNCSEVWSKLLTGALRTGLRLPARIVKTPASRHRPTVRPADLECSAVLLIRPVNSAQTDAAAGNIMQAVGGRGTEPTQGSFESSAGNDAATRAPRPTRKEISMSLILLVVILLLVCGGGGGYYGYRRWGSGGGIGIVGVVLVVLVVLYMFGGLRISG